MIIDLLEARLNTINTELKNPGLPKGTMAFGCEKNFEFFCAISRKMPPSTQLACPESIKISTFRTQFLFLSLGSQFAKNCDANFPAKPSP